MKVMLAGECFTICRNYSVLGGAVPLEVARTQDVKASDTHGYSSAALTKCSPSHGASQYFTQLSDWTPGSLTTQIREIAWAGGTWLRG